MYGGRYRLSRMEYSLEKRTTRSGKRSYKHGETVMEVSLKKTPSYTNIQERRHQQQQQPVADVCAIYLKQDHDSQRVLPAPAGPARLLPQARHTACVFPTTTTTATTTTMTLITMTIMTTATTMTTAATGGNQTHGWRLLLHTYTPGLFPA